MSANSLLIEAGNSIGANRDFFGRNWELKFAAGRRRIGARSAEQKRAYALADNKLTLYAGRDGDLLAAEVEELIAADIDFDNSVFGFDPGEIDPIIHAPSPSETGVPQDRHLPEVEDFSVSQPGDLLILSDHKPLWCDALNEQYHARLIGDERAQMVFADRPLNVPIDRHVCRSEKN